jgi:hypothetical protein
MKEEYKLNINEIFKVENNYKNIFVFAAVYTFYWFIYLHKLNID